ncbi:MAG: TAXI family TRAP transporter solute-binding subunit [Desulfobacteraceae bacterium]|jgi:TRAP transporter TAXI family solute receptor|nr:MAG: TAXI family TRAP transporter solute-binding subunit [Desulfobacteraceae bacterium]
MERSACLGVVLSLIVCVLGLASTQSLAAEPLPKSVRFASLSVGMSGHLVAAGIGTVMTKHSPIKVAVDPVGMHVAVLDLVEKKEAQMGAVGTLDLVPYWRGEQFWKGRPQCVLAGMTTINMFTLVHTTPKSGIKTVQDLRGKRFLGDAIPSPSVAAYSDALLNAYGMTRNDVKWLQFSKAPDAAAALIEGRAEAYAYPSSSPPMQQLKTTVGYYPIPVDPEPAKKMIETLLGYTYETMPAGYNGVIEEGVPALAYYTTIFFRDDVPDEVVYTLVKAALENKSEYARVHPLLQDVDARRASTIVGIPFHPGAIKYFKESGVWTAQQEKENNELLTKFKR